MIDNQKETPQEKPKSAPTVNVIVIVVHSTSFSIRPKTTRIIHKKSAERNLVHSSIHHQYVTLYQNTPKNLPISVNVNVNLGLNFSCKLIGILSQT